MSAVTAPIEALVMRTLGGAARTRVKEWKEFRYWKKKQVQEIDLTNSHYAWFYTECFGLGLKDFRGHKLLDVGCGPRGSLEWAVGAAEAVGVDPLADRYRGLQTRDHRMTYVNAYAEAMPFTNSYLRRCVLLQRAGPHSRFPPRADGDRARAQARRPLPADHRSEPRADSPRSPTASCPMSWRRFWKPGSISRRAAYIACAATTTSIKA